LIWGDREIALGPGENVIDDPGAVADRDPIQIGPAHLIFRVFR
jgi:hypothetical protein